MNKRQKKKHLKKALRLSLISIELADKYLRRYRVKATYNLDIWTRLLKSVIKIKRKQNHDRTTTKAL